MPARATQLDVGVGDVGVRGVGLNYVGAICVGVLDVGVGVWISFCGPQARLSHPVGRG